MERIVILSAYVISFSLLIGGVGMSDVYILNIIGESIPSCVTPAFIVACFDFVLLYRVNSLRPRMQLDRLYDCI